MPGSFLLADLGALFDPAIFADAATVDGRDVRGIFDADYVEPLDVQSSGPSILLRSADCASVKRGSSVVVDAGAFRVAVVRPDGTGLTRLKLERA